MSIKDQSKLLGRPNILEQIGGCNISGTLSRFKGPRNATNTFTIQSDNGSSKLVFSGKGVNVVKKDSNHTIDALVDYNASLYPGLLKYGVDYNIKTEDSKDIPLTHLTMKMNYSPNFTVTLSQPMAVYSSIGANFLGYVECGKADFSSRTFIIPMVVASRYPADKGGLQHGVIMNNPRMDFSVIINSDNVSETTMDVDMDELTTKKLRCVNIPFIYENVLALDCTLMQPNALPDMDDNLIPLREGDTYYLFILIQQRYDAMGHWEDMNKKEVHNIFGGTTTTLFNDIPLYSSLVTINSGNTKVVTQKYTATIVGDKITTETETSVDPADGDKGELESPTFMITSMTFNTNVCTIN